MTAHTPCPSQQSPQTLPRWQRTWRRKFRQMTSEALRIMQLFLQADDANAFYRDWEDDTPPDVIGRILLKEIDAALASSHKRCKAASAGVVTGASLSQSKPRASRPRTTRESRTAGKCGAGAGGILWPTAPSAGSTGDLA